MTEDIPTKVKNSDGKTMKAGGIVVCNHDGNKFVILVYRPNCNDWNFPKGHIEQGETPEEASIREINEETGLKISAGIRLPDETYANKNNPDGVIVKMFLYRVDRERLHNDEDVCSPSWIPIEEVENKLSYQNLQEYFKSIKHLI